MNVDICRRCNFFLTLANWFYDFYYSNSKGSALGKKRGGKIIAKKGCNLLSGNLKHQVQKRDKQLSDF